LRFYRVKKNAEPPPPGGRPAGSPSSAEAVSTLLEILHMFVKMLFELHKAHPVSTLLEILLKRICCIDSFPVKEQVSTLLEILPRSWYSYRPAVLISLFQPFLRFYLVLLQRLRKCLYGVSTLLEILRHVDFMREADGYIEISFNPS